MADWKPSDARKIAATTTAKTENFVSSVTSCLIVADADCYVDFDRTATTSSLLIKANQVPAYIPLMFTYISVVAVSTANVYVLGIRQQTGR